jgi:hypothetical protein
MKALSLQYAIEKFSDREKYIEMMGELFQIKDIQEDNQGKFWIWFGEDYSRSISKRDFVFIKE